MNRCAYCDVETVGLFCCQECENRYNKFMAFQQKYLVPFILGMFAPFLLLFLPIFFGNMMLFFGLVFVLMGLTVTVFPFVTDETYGMYGVKRSIKLGRSLGVVVIITGLLMAMVELVSFSFFYISIAVIGLGTALIPKPPDDTDSFLKNLTNFGRFLAIIMLLFGVVGTVLFFL